MKFFIIQTLIFIKLENFLKFNLITEIILNRLNSKLIFNFHNFLIPLI